MCYDIEEGGTRQSFVRREYTQKYTLNVTHHPTIVMSSNFHQQMADYEFKLDGNQCYIKRLQ